MGRGTRMRWLALCLVPLACLTVFGSAANETDWEKADLHGSVKSVVTQEADLSQSFGVSVEGPKHSVSAIYYDSSGRKTEDWEYSDTGALETKTLYSYDAAGKLVESREYSTYGTLTGVTKYEYDAAGRRLGTTDYTAKGAIDGRSICRLDAAGNIVSIDSYDSDGAIETRLTFSFDASGRDLETCGYDKTGARITRTANEYDGSGHLTRMSVEAFWPEDGSLIMKGETTYDDNGNEATSTMGIYGIVALMAAATGNTSGVPSKRYEYVLDAQGNWTKKTQSDEVTKFGSTYWEPKKVTYRTITYY
jgi:hypothetical protein